MTETMNPVLTELQVDGELRKVLIQANRNGFFYVLDRTTGEFIRANPFVEKTTWTDGLDKETGRPSRSESIEHMLETGEPTEICLPRWAQKIWRPCHTVLPRDWRI